MSLKYEKEYIWQNMKYPSNGPEVMFKWNTTAHTKNNVIGTNWIMMYITMLTPVENLDQLTHFKLCEYTGRPYLSIHLPHR